METDNVAFHRYTFTRTDKASVFIDLAISIYNGRDTHLFVEEQIFIRLDIHKRKP